MTSGNHVTGLEPCPFCGWPYIELHPDNPNVAWCPDCRAQGPLISFGLPTTPAQRSKTRAKEQPCRKWGGTKLVQENSGPPVQCDLCAKEQPIADDEVELVTDAIVAAIKADCTEPNGNCYAVGNRDAMEVDGEFDPEAIARAAIAAISRTDDRLREALASIAETMPGRTHKEASAQRREIARTALKTPARGEGE